MKKMKYSDMKMIKYEKLVQVESHSMSRNFKMFYQNKPSTLLVNI